MRKPSLVDIAAIQVRNALDDVVRIIDAQMDAKGRHATGRTRRETRAEVTTTADLVKGVVYVPPYFDRIEAGSPPQRETRQFYTDIHEWAKAKGIVSGDDEESWHTSSTIAHHIAKYGTIAWRAGGEEVFTAEVDRRLEQLDADTADAIYNNITRFI